MIFIRAMTSPDEAFRSWILQLSPTGFQEHWGVTTATVPRVSLKKKRNVKDKRGRGKKPTQEQNCFLTHLPPSLILFCKDLKSLGIASSLLLAGINGNWWQYQFSRPQIPFLPSSLFFPSPSCSTNVPIKKEFHFPVISFHWVGKISNSRLWQM